MQKYLALNKVEFTMSGIQSKITSIYIHTSVCCRMFTTPKQPKCPLIVEWIKKMPPPHTQQNITQPQKNEVLSFVTTWMDLEGIMYAK